MKVLITGASGFLGSHIAERLQGGGHELRLLLRQTSSTEYLQDVEYERAEGDIRNTESLRQAVQGVDAVVHCAGLLSAGSYEEYEAVNGRATAELVYLARDAGVQRFVYISSLAAQGPSPDGNIQPPEPALPVSAYGRTKLAGEYAVRAERMRFNTSIMRLPVIYGPRDRGLLSFYVMAKYGFITVYGDGQNLLSWVHAYDAADAVATVLERSEKSGSVYTVCDGPPHTWLDLATAVGDAFGKNLRIIKTPPTGVSTAATISNLLGKVVKKPLPLTAEKAAEMKHRYWICDNSLIEEQVGWRPQVPYKAGVLDTLNWYREHGWLKLSNL